MLVRGALVSLLGFLFLDRDNVEKRIAQSPSAFVARRICLLQVKLSSLFLDAPFHYVMLLMLCFYISQEGRVEFLQLFCAAKHHHHPASVSPIHATAV